MLGVTRVPAHEDISSSTESTSTQLLQPLTSKDVRLFEFIDPVVQAQYDQFRKEDTSWWMLAIYLVIQTVGQIFLTLMSLQTSLSAMLIIFRVIRTISPIPGWMLFYMVTWPRHSAWLNRYISARHLGDIYIVLNAMALSSTMLFRAMAGACDKNTPFFDEFDCNPMSASNSLPQDSLVVLVVGSVIIHMIIKCHTIKVLVMHFAISFSSILAAIIVAKAPEASAFLYGLFAVFVMLVFYEHNNINAYMVLRNMEHTVRKSLAAENDKRLFEKQSVEIRALMGNVAHDLKTPMQSFVMDLEGLEKLIQPYITSTNYSVVLTRDILTNVMDAVHNMTDTNTFMTMVINRAIDYTKCSSGYTLTPNLLTINITETIQWAIRIVSGKSRVPIVFEPLPSNICSYIITDKQWLIENILCLVSNATKFTMHGSVTIRCELQVEAVNGEEYICIEVEDTGIGIPEEMRTMMFRPFQQTMRMAGGTGLGLYSLHQRVDALKGTCGICDRRDGASGACVWFRIPYRCDTDAAAVEEPSTVVALSSFVAGDIELGLMTSETKEAEIFIALSPPEMQSDELSASVNSTLSPRWDVESQISSNATPRDGELAVPSVQSRRILLIDDSVIVRKSVSRALSAEGFIIDLAENGLMGLEMMQAKMYDLVLLDIQMPMMDGLEAAKRMRKFESEIPGRHQNIIGISAFSTDQVRNDALGAGMDGFIEKPFKVGVLMDTCRSCGFPLG